MSKDQPVDDMDRLLVERNELRQRVGVAEGRVAEFGAIIDAIGVGVAAMSAHVIDLHAILRALEPHGWKQSNFGPGLYRLVGDMGVETINVGLPGRTFVYQGSWAEVPYRGLADRLEAEGEVVLAHLIAKEAEKTYPREAR